MAIQTLTFAAIPGFGIFCDRCAAEVQQNGHASALQVTIEHCIRSHVNQVHRLDVGFFRRPPRRNGEVLTLEFRCGRRSNVES